MDGNKVLLAKFGDCTMLDDVEAPSRLWENTIAVDSGFRTSPVKMVGLMRPSTILEEPGDESTNSDVSHSSYKTISTKGAQSDISSVYDTANETTVSSSRTDVSNQHCQFKEIDVEDMLMMAIEKSRNRTLTSQIKPRIETLEKSCTKTNTSSEGEDDDVNASVNLIDLEKTLGSSEITKYTSESSNNATPDIVVIDDDQKEINELHDTVGDDDISVIDILSDEEDEHQEKSSVSRKSIKLEDNFDNYTLNDENKENYTFESSDPSIKFNDTMEEVEYLLKRGMEYMTAKENEVAEQSIQHTNDTNCASKVYRTQPNSPMLTTNPKIPPVNSESKGIHKMVNICSIYCFISYYSF